jgi:hypothetical protein
MYVALLLAAALAVPQTGFPAASKAPSQTKSGSPYRLGHDEEIGGHTLSRHSGVADDELRNQLEDNLSIKLASTFFNRATAEQVVGDTLAQNAAEFVKWRQREGDRPNLVLRYTNNKPIGRCMRRGESPRQCNNATIILKWNKTAFMVLEAYPEP